MGSQGTGDERRHLTWRDLPPTPPTGRDWSLEPDLPAEVPPVAFEAEPARHRGRRRTFAVGAAAAALVAVGVVAAVAAPSLATGSAAISRSSSGADQSLNGAAPSAGTSGGQSGAGGTAPNGGSGSSQPGTASPTTPPAGTSGSEPLADTASRILPSVVQIETGGGLGSGFVADGKGDILTAAHVVAGASQVTVKTQDGSSVQGTVVAADTSIDVAVVRIARTDIPALPLADSDQVRVGQVAIAVGSPFGLDETVTSGIVSALNRTLDTGSTRQTGLIQTDTPINPGNSGGPLTDRSGNVIGINDAIASTSGQSSGVGFAVPINQAKVLLEQAQNGTVPSQSQPGSQGGSGQGTDPFGSNGTDPFGGLFGGSNPFGSNGSGGSSGTDPFGGLFGGSNPFGNSDPSQGGSGSQQDQLFQWFFGQVLPGLGQGQSGATQ